MRVAVIGAGAAGTAAARFLAKAGHTVTVFEQFELGHDRGSSHGTSRIIRRVYPDSLYTALMERAYPLWEGLEEETGGRLLFRTGGVYFGPRDHPDMVSASASMSEAKHECLECVSARQRFPQFRFGEEEMVIVDPSMGYLDASACVRAMANSAVRHGTTLRTGYRVEGIEPLDRGVRVDGEGFDVAAITAGPWTTRFCPELPLTITKQQKVFFRSDGARFRSPDMPVWIDAETLYYGFPDIGAGVKAAAHVPGPATDPDSLTRDADASQARDLQEYLARRLPGLGEPHTVQTCLYTNTPDGDFVIDRISDRTAVCTACSGHGFKFAILAGQMLAT